MTAVLTAGLWPGQPAPRNRITLVDSGLRLLPPSQAITTTGLWAKQGEFSLELWLTRADPGAKGNLEIAGLWNEASEPALILGQWPGGLYLHSRYDNPAALPELDRYARLDPEAAMHTVAMVGDSQGIRLSVDGKPLPAVIPIDPARSRPRFGGRLLLGSSGGDSHGFAGVIHAAVLYQRALSPTELRQHADLAVADLSDLQASSGMIALYQFEGHQPGPIAKHPAAAPEMLLPDRVQKPDPALLSFKLSPRWDGPGLAWDLAINVLGFVPLGLVITWGRNRRAFLAALAVGLTLSLAIEITQFWLPGRSSSGIDVLCNTVGALLGGWIARMPA